MATMLNNTYRSSMLRHPYGYALYEPQSSTIVKPGACGYIDPENGRFVPLIKNNRKVDLEDPESLRASGLTILDNVNREEPESRYWGPKVSNDVNGFKLDFKAEASLIPAGIPANIGTLYEFKTDQEFGAILMTEAPVMREAIYGSTSLRKWCRDNTRALLSNWPEIRDHGLIIVTSTYLTNRADINSWQEKGKKIAIGFEGSAVGAFELAPSGRWHSAASAQGWNAFPATNGTKRVVFFGGLYFKYRRLAPVLPQQNALHQRPLAILRSAPDAKNFQLEHDGIEYEVQGEEIGTEEVVPTPPPEAAEDEEEGDANF